MEQTIQDIFSRSSIRKYTSEPVPTEGITLMLHAAMAAPTAGDKRPWHFVVVTSQEVLAKLAAANPYAHFIAKAPMAIVVCGDISRAYPGNEQQLWIQDASAATENILLAAHAMGLGAVWTAIYPLQDRIQAVSQALELPENLIPFCTIPVGFPDQEAKPRDKFNPADITWIA